MRIKRTIFWLLMLFTVLLNAQMDQFEQALTAYNKGDYQESIDLLETISTGENESVEAYYNLGLAHLKADNIGEGIANLQRALILSPQHVDTRAALEIAQSKISTPITEIPDFILYETYTDIARSMSINTWVIIQSCCLLGFVMAFYWMLFRTTKRRSLLYVIMIGFLLLSIWSYSNASYLRDSVINPDLVVVGQEDTEIFIGADERSEVVSIVGEGITARVIDDISDWIKIELADKDVGWVQKNKVIIL